mmetsp:Transcript_18984/g.49392  ORF Transcript_18984/g.49392 Transcript_18984/m.49392 type:complete len:459 (-) Transcript_18984:336-1712(-)
MCDGVFPAPHAPISSMKPETDDEAECDIRPLSRDSSNEPSSRRDAITASIELSSDETRLRVNDDEADAEPGARRSPLIAALLVVVAGGEDMMRPCENGSGTGARPRRNGSEPRDAERDPSDDGPAVRPAHADRGGESIAAWSRISGDSRGVFGTADPFPGEIGMGADRGGVPGGSSRASSSRSSSGASAPPPPRGAAAIGRRRRGSGLSASRPVDRGFEKNPVATALRPSTRTVICCSSGAAAAAAAASASWFALSAPPPALDVRSGGGSRGLTAAKWLGRSLFSAGTNPESAGSAWACGVAIADARRGTRSAVGAGAAAAAITMAAGPASDLKWNHGRPGHVDWKWASRSSCDWLSCSGVNRFRASLPAAGATRRSAGSRRRYATRRLADGSRSSHELRGEKWRKERSASSSSLMSTSGGTVAMAMSDGDAGDAFAISIEKSGVSSRCQLSSSVSSV